VDGVNLVRLLGTCDEHLIQYGGHERAAGFSLPTDEVDLFRQTFVAGVQAAEVGQRLTPFLIDGVLRLSSVGPRLADLVERFEPSGAGNPRPLFLTKNALVRSVGKLKGGHVRLQIAQEWATRRAVAFRPTFPAPKPGTRVDVIYEVERSVWNGVERVDMLVRDLRESGAEEPYSAATV
jgi:single-stranded-DNA-specific exonuclease